jgi:hypothetical protein
MPCECEHAHDPAHVSDRDSLVLAMVDQIATAVAAPLGGQIAELSRLLEHPSPVVQVANRLTMFTTLFLPTDGTPLRILNQTLDRVQATVYAHNIFGPGGAWCTVGGAGIVNARDHVAAGRGAIPTNCTMLKAPVIGGDVNPSPLVYRSTDELWASSAVTQAIAVTVVAEHRQ